MENKYILTLKFNDETEPDVTGIIDLLYDLNIAYEYSFFKEYRNNERGNIDDWIEDVYFNFHCRNLFRRKTDKGRENQLKVLTIKKESPLVLEVVVPLVGCAWVMIQMFQKVRNWPLERRKLELEVSKLDREERERRERVSDEYVSQLGRMNDIEQEIIDNLSANKHQLRDLKVTAYKDRVTKQR